MLKFLIVETEKKGRYDPISVPVSTPVFDGKNGESFPKIALQCDTMEEGRVIFGRIGRGIVERGEIIFEPTSNPPACILERFINIGHKLSSDCSQTSAILAPDPQSVTLVGIGHPLVDQPGVQKCGRQTPKADPF